MPNMYDINGLTYQPSSHMDWFTKAIFGGKLIEKGKITPVTGVKENTLLNMIELSGSLLQADEQNCAWTPNQIAKLSDIELKIKTYKINMEQCIDDLEKKRTVWMLSPGARNAELPATLEEATMEMLAAELSKEIETKIFNGDSSVESSDFDGVLKVLDNSSNAIKLQGIALTTDNILGEIQKVFTAIPDDVLASGLENGSLSIFMSYAALTKVRIALANVQSANMVVNPNFTIENDAVKYMGVELVAVAGIGENNIVAADARNFLLGTDLLSDIEELRFGQFAAPYDNKVFIDGRLRLGFVIPFEDEVVYYNPNNQEAEL